MKRGARISAAFAAVALVCGVTSCAATKPPVVPSDASVEPAVTVVAIDNSYQPQVVEIEAGQAVRWVFEGAAKHDVVAEDGSFVSELQTGGEYVHVFNEAGEYAYDCSIHPEMTGTVVVR